MLNPVHVNMRKWNKKPQEFKLQPGLPQVLNEWHFWQLSIQRYKIQELDFKWPLVQIQRSPIEGTDATRGKNELRKRRAAVTAPAKHYKATELIPRKQTRHNKDSFIVSVCQLTASFTLTPTTVWHLLSTAAFPVLRTPRGAVSDCSEHINCLSCICTCRDTPLLSCILLSPRRNRCEDDYVYSKEWSEPASAACRW